MQIIVGPLDFTFVTERMHMPGYPTTTYQVSWEPDYSPAGSLYDLFQFNVGLVPDLRKRDLTAQSMVLRHFD